ncbi:hypothetical protein CRENBAI_015116 [Crenichthys baileyi]|uniref:Cyclin C-terminal domain-containing protein n=1 Tax=Crenichthys baileyi TaxID=28760 RepID=A0AAV9SJ78_9TELE
MELTLLDYELVHYRPLRVAAASLCLSHCCWMGLPWVSCPLSCPALCCCWLEKSLPLSSVTHSSSTPTYDEATLRPIMQHVARTGDGERKAVKKKYSSSKLMKISLLPQLRSSIIQKLAAPLLNDP